MGDEDGHATWLYCELCHERLTGGSRYSPPTVATPKNHTYDTDVRRTEAYTTVPVGSFLRARSLEDAMGAFEDYLRLQEKLLALRKANDGAESAEEDDLLDDMDAVWYRLTPEQQERVQDFLLTGPRRCDKLHT